MQSTGRTTGEQIERERSGRQAADDRKRDTRYSLMKQVARETGAVVLRAPLTRRGEIEHTRWAYHEKMRGYAKDR